MKFEGFKSPLNYYKRAFILIPTFNFEDFPLVLVVYDSYAAVGDTSTDDKDGYKADENARMVTEVIEGDERRNRMAQEAIKKEQGV